MSEKLHLIGLYFFSQKYFLILFSLKTHFSLMAGWLVINSPQGHSSHQRPVLALNAPITPKVVCFSRLL